MPNVTGERIRELRLKKELSQEQLGKMLGYTGRAAISKIETGVNDISAERVSIRKGLVSVFLVRSPVTHF